MAQGFNEATSYVDLAFTKDAGEVLVQNGDKTRADYRAPVPAKVNHDLAICFNGEMLAKAVRALSGDLVTLLGNTAQAPVMLKDGFSSQLLMPVVDNSKAARAAA